MTQALERLIDAVEAGQSRPKLEDLACWAWPDDGSIWGGVSAAAHGDLNAAKALHESLLPGWTASIVQNIHHRHWFAAIERVTEIGEYQVGGSGQHEDNPARAWLLATLRAKLAENNLTTRDETSV